MIVFEGWDASGKGTTIAALTQRLDPRGFKLYPITAPRTYEQQRPWLWRFWLKVPNRGEMVIFDHSWYGRVLEERVERTVPEKAWREAYRDIVEFERMLADDGATILKFFLHISKKEQKERFQAIETGSAGSLARDRCRLGAQQEIRRVPGRHRGDAGADRVRIRAVDHRRSHVEMVRAEEGVRDHHRRHGEAPGRERAAPKRGDVAAVEGCGLARGHGIAGRGRPLMLETVDLTRTLDRDAYVREVTRRQIQLRELGYQVYLQKRPVVIAFEGWDAAGKGGAIKRITEKLDPRGYVVYPISAPQGEDKTRHYLYRFWRRLPERGQIAIFDRSWYGRVLVERVEGFAKEEEWKRAFKEINSFERQLRDFGMILAKFWIHISREEQFRRFEERKAIGYKAWKLTDEDWRNREKWGAYEEAVEEMLVKTSTQYAPWCLVEGNDKYWARAKVLARLVEILSEGLGYEPADPLKGRKKERAKLRPDSKGQRKSRPKPVH